MKPDISRKQPVMCLMSPYRLIRTKVGNGMNFYPEDEARKEYTRRAMDGAILPRISDIEDIIGESPYVVIGDFAYTVGHDECIWMAPLETVRTDIRYIRYASVKYVNWGLAVNLDTSGVDDSLDNLGANRLIGVLGDASNVADIMRQTGVQTDTDKRV